MKQTIGLTCLLLAALLMAPMAAAQEDLANGPNGLARAIDGYKQLLDHMRAAPAMPLQQLQQTETVPRLPFALFDRPPYAATSADPVYRLPRSSPEQAGCAYSGVITAAALRYGIRPSFLQAVVAAESNYDPLAVSPRGARGLAQIMPETAITLGVDPNRLMDPEVNVETAARLIRQLAERYNGRIETILTAYNAGPAYADARGPIPRETRDYFAQVKNTYQRNAGSDRCQH